jgi:uncharacterized membrane protein AbrB (regulator of aidB expression)
MKKNLIIRLIIFTLFAIIGSRLISYFDGFWSGSAAVCIHNPLVYLWEYHPAMMIGWSAVITVYVILVLLTGSKADRYKDRWLLFVPLILLLLLSAFSIAQNVGNSGC